MNMAIETSLTGTHRLTSQEFSRLAELVYRTCGINLELSKKTMVESRLNRRLRLLNMKSFADYIQLVTNRADEERELIHMVDAISTNKTDFFREPHHFEFLESHILPDVVRPGESRPLRVWSAACSSGEEPYTLAMILQETRERNPNFSYEILASDISTSVLTKAVEAIYTAERANDIPLHYRKKYVMKSKDTVNPRIRISKVLRDAVTFSRVNLVEDFQLNHLQDIIFCRNVLIYFDRETQLKVINNLLRKLTPGGFLFIGHSESLHFFELPIKQVRPTIFIKN
jgi:chemotaxis protein methyltransferase CheR